MTKEELAARLNGREYGNEITDAEEAEAKRAGLVVVFGYSDDNAEFRGAINDEVGCYEGGEIVLVGGAIYAFEECDCKHTERADAAAREKGRRIEAVWCEGDYSWTYRTEIQHATFDVMEGGEKYCRGIVFELPD